MRRPRATCSPALSCAPTSICRTASPSAACSSACWRSAPTCSNDARPLLGRPGHAGRGQAGGIIAGRGQGRTDASRDHAGAAAQPGRGAGRRRRTRPVADSRRRWSRRPAACPPPLDLLGRRPDVPLDLLGRRPDVARTDASRDHAGATAQPGRGAGRPYPQRPVADRDGAHADRRRCPPTCRWTCWAAVPTWWPRAREAARHAIDTAKAEFYPNINLTAFAGFQAMGTGLLARAWPASVRHDLAAHLPRRRAQRQSGGPPRDADLAVSDYSPCWTPCARWPIRCACWTRNGEQRQARAIEAATVKRYKAGMGNYLSVLIAQTGVLEARLDTDLRIAPTSWTPTWPTHWAAATRRPPPLTPSPRAGATTATDPDSDVMNAPATNPAPNACCCSRPALSLIAITSGGPCSAPISKTPTTPCTAIWCRSRRRCPAPSSPSRPTTPKP